VGLRLAQEQLRGTLSRVLAEERDRLIQLLAKVEASIDFTEEDISFVSAAELAASIRTTSEAVARLIASAQAGRIFREGVGAAIVGRPNVGKSSLLNALLESDRAIVTPIPGTTRDVLEEVLNVRGIAVRVLDTAGLRTTHDPVEEEGVRRSQRAIEEADVLLIVLDGSCPLGEEDQAVLACAPGKRRVIVVNKSDLPWAWQLEDGLPTDQSRGTDVRVIRVSAKLGQGLDGLKDQLRDLVLRADVEPPATAMVTTLRHQLALERTQDALAQALASANAGMSGEFVAMDLRAATDALGEIVGAVCTDDILDRIFKDFCIGK
jgi:tRNA modification GTPase